MTFTANGAVNGSHLVAVNLVVSAGPPAVFSIFPTSIIQAPTVNPMISLPNRGPWCLWVTNPAPPNAPGQPPACTPTAPTDCTFNVVANTTMAVSSLLDAASYQQSAKQPTQTRSRSGKRPSHPARSYPFSARNLGPNTLLPATPDAVPAILTSSASLAGTLNTSGLTLQFTVTGTVVTVNFAVNVDLAHVVRWRSRPRCRAPPPVS